MPKQNARYVNVALSPKAYEALQRLAERDARAPGTAARLILEDALTYLDEEKGEPSPAARPLTAALTSRDRW
jgi:hypothetical protein